MLLLVPSSLILDGDHMCQLVQRHQSLLVAPLGPGINGRLLLVIVIVMRGRLMMTQGEGLLRLFPR